MSTAIIQGGKPLIGSVKVSGSLNTALKLIYASLFSNQDIILDNVPIVKALEEELDILRSIGVSCEWVGPNKLRLNSAGIHSFKLEKDIAAVSKLSLLAVGPLIYRFGQAIIPIPTECKIGSPPINRFLESWKSLGFKIEEEVEYIHVTANTATSSSINFKSSSHTATDNAILSSIFARGDVVIHKAAQEPEVDFLIDFCNQLGANVKRTEPDVIKIIGTDVFRSTAYKIPSDRDQVVFYSIAALVTSGNITIQGVDRSALLPFMNILTKLGCKFEFISNDLRIWHAGEELLATSVTVGAAPSFIPSWQSLLVLLLTQSSGKGLVYDTVYTDRFDFVKDLNRMGSKVRLLRPSEAGYDLQIGDDSYDLKLHGEPYTVAEIIGPTKLKGTRLIISNLKYGPVLPLAALIAEGKSEIAGYDNIERYYENVTENLIDLGALIEVV